MPLDVKVQRRPWPFEQKMSAKAFRRGPPAFLPPSRRSRPSSPIAPFNFQPEETKTPRPKLSLHNPEGIIQYFEEHVERWAEWKLLHIRLESFGIPKDDIYPLLDLFIDEVLAGRLSAGSAYDKYSLDRFARSLPGDLPKTYADQVYTGILYAWAADPANQRKLEAVISPAAIISIQLLFKAAHSEHLEDRFDARRTRRKVILHVGPTNSGKTHHALRALAAAQSGVYAGPLRLLAHEIWERLNLGQIVPAGIEEDAALPSLDSALDVASVGTTPAVRSQGNPLYVRKCNMITGEEHKIVDPDCTLKYDVAIIDEIQMITDVERGSAWTNAVLGINAKEVHLCGEETAVPIVQAILANTHDEIEVRRYERLTPLSISESLDGDFKNVKKGDCVVTFSRNSIFQVREAIEKSTGMKCAVVYGKLPPEIRSGQASLFNDPNSGYDVIVGSDAIGMGLNLKIRRIVFEVVSKWDGHSKRPLSTSQTKQIAGRAGRFGMTEEKGGLVTTLLSEDVPFLEKTLALPFTPLPVAILGPNYDSSRAVAQALPPSAGLLTIFDAHIYVAKTKPHYRYALGNISNAITNVVDRWADKLALEDRITFLMAPVPWRDLESLQVVHKLMEAFARDLSVPVKPLFDDTPYYSTLLDVERKMATLPQPKSNAAVLSVLEGFHKLLGLYAWLSLRNPVAYYEPEVVEDWKPRVEKALHWALQGVTPIKKSEIRQTAATRDIKYQSVIDIRRKQKESVRVSIEQQKKAIAVGAYAR
ncbi:P-loop containing nucleoside triphosphate hydrolase protein [Rhodocollybia butyracea]|uniref:P-loop containing nucleoside triphosphate hydrolase protein n=1 Tax=Rhodocollybia butyracea TaxID=206335 RepID=A0A9P5QAD1_9AGAR|nr:P-loop containing nucleoside triphosphate hydrolase protein [Rhodocollybia butyracea]